MCDVVPSGKRRGRRPSGDKDGAQTDAAGAAADHGADACVQTLQLNLEVVDGTWLVSNVTTLTEG